MQEVFDIQVWLQKCNTISCCTIRCIYHIPPEELTTFKNEFQPMGKQEQELLLK